MVTPNQDFVRNIYVWVAFVVLIVGISVIVCGKLHTFASDTCNLHSAIFIVTILSVLGMTSSHLFDFCVTIFSLCSSIAWYPFFYQLYYARTEVPILQEIFEPKWLIALNLCTVLLIQIRAKSFPFIYPVIGIVLLLSYFWIVEAELAYLDTRDGAILQMQMLLKSGAMNVIPEKYRESNLSLHQYRLEFTCLMIGMHVVWTILSFVFWIMDPINDDSSRPDNANTGNRNSHSSSSSSSNNGKTTSNSNNNSNNNSNHDFQTPGKIPDDCVEISLSLIHI